MALHSKTAQRNKGYISSAPSLAPVRCTLADITFHTREAGYHELHSLDISAHQGTRGSRYNKG